MEHGGLKLGLETLRSMVAKGWSWRHRGAYVLFSLKNPNHDDSRGTMIESRLDTSQHEVGEGCELGEGVSKGKA